MSPQSQIEKEGPAGGKDIRDFPERPPISALENNTPIDTTLDLKILGESAQLHGGHLPIAAPDDKDISVHQTNSGDVWIQLTRRQADNESLDDASFSAYIDLFSEIGRQKGQLVRIWNQIPRILATENGVIRYHRFNSGRLKAWENFGKKSGGGRLLLPAATGIGSAGTFLFIRAFCSAYPLIRLQNPRQIPPDEYSVKYGARPPVFSRASILLEPDRHCMFVSGTASIIGEDTLHIGDPVMQTKETLNNLRSLIAGDNCRQYGYDGVFGFNDLKSMRVYLKSAEHFDDVRETIMQQVFCPTTYKLCDICREDLLVEIECIFERRTG